MKQMHKHSGVVRSDTGVRRNHPVSQKHNDPNVQAAHNKVVGKNKVKTLAKAVSKPKPSKVTFTKSVMCPVDSEGYIHIDLRGLTQKGIRLKFERTRGRTKRTVGLQIEK